MGCGEGVRGRELGPLGYGGGAVEGAEVGVGVERVVQEGDVAVAAEDLWVCADEGVVDV